MSIFRSVYSRRISLVAAAVLSCLALLGASLWGRVNNDALDLRYRAVAEARMVAANIDNYFSTIESLLNVLGTVVSTSPSDVDINDRVLRRSKSEAPSSIANIMLFSLDGKNIGNAVGEHAGAGDRDYFLRARAGAPFVVGDPIRSRSKLGWVFPVARPVRNDAGEMQAVLVVAIFLDSLREMISVNERPMGQITRVVNDRGIGLASNSTAPTVVAKDFIQKSAMTEGGEVTVSNGNVTHLVGFSATHRVPWLVAVGLPDGVWTRACRQGPLGVDCS